jgi:glycosyltransferase involved in cell wall biosynthesis
MPETAPVSLVTTVLNEATSIGTFLSSVGAQTVAPTEIVIVDGGSTDGTVELLRSWAGHPATAVRVLEQRGANIAEGRNIAIEAASQSLVAIADAGTVLEPDWLHHLVSSLDDQTDVAAGFFRPGGETFMERLIARVITPLLDEIDGDRFLPSSRSVAIRKSTWMAAGGYPEWLDYCEDLVFDLAMLRSGARFSFVPDASVTWTGRPSLPALARTYFRYARGDGKAGLWPRRHAARYTAYVVGVALVARTRRSPTAGALLAAGFAAYTSKFLRRTWSERRGFGGMTPVALGLTPLIVVVGDVAKMAGYPVGLYWRSQADRRPDPRP